MSGDSVTPSAWAPRTPVKRETIISTGRPYVGGPSSGEVERDGRHETGVSNRAYWRSDGLESMRVDLLGVSYDLGTIQIGKLADLVIWDGSDLDVTDMRSRIHAVIQDGAVVAGRPGS